MHSPWTLCLSVEFASFLARLHFSAEELLLYPPRQRRASASASASTYKMLGQMLKSWNFSLSDFFVAFKLCLGQEKNMCVYCHMLKKIRVGRSEIIFFLILFFITELMLDGI